MNDFIALSISHASHGSVSHIGLMHAHNGNQNEGMLSAIADKLSDNLVVDHSTGMIHSEMDSITVLVPDPSVKL
jgi:hypothetical protein